MSITSLSPSPAAATAATAGVAASRAAAELAQFQQRQFGDDVDPDGPAAMKDSPSVSGDEEAGELDVFCMPQIVFTEKVNFSGLLMYNQTGIPALFRCIVTVCRAKECLNLVSFSGTAYLRAMFLGSSSCI